MTEWVKCDGRGGRSDGDGGRGGEISPNLSRAQANRVEHSAFGRQAQDLIDTRRETCEVSQLSPSRYFITALCLKSDSQLCLSPCRKLWALENFDVRSGFAVGSRFSGSVNHFRLSVLLYIYMWLRLLWHDTGCQWKQCKVLSDGYKDFT